MKKVEFFVLVSFMVLLVSGVAYANSHVTNPNPGTTKCDAVCDSTDVYCKDGTTLKKDCTALVPAATTATCECSCTDKFCPKAVSHTTVFGTPASQPGQEEVTNFCIDYLSTHSE